MPRRERERAIERERKIERERESERGRKRERRRERERQRERERLWKTGHEREIDRYSDRTEKWCMLPSTRESLHMQDMTQSRRSDQM